MQQNLIKNQTNSIEMRKRIIANFFFLLCSLRFLLSRFSFVDFPQPGERQMGMCSSICHWYLPKNCKHSLSLFLWPLLYKCDIEIDDVFEENNRLVQVYARIVNAESNKKKKQQQLRQRQRKNCPIRISVHEHAQQMWKIIYIQHIVFCEKYFLRRTAIERERNREYLFAEHNIAEQNRYADNKRAIFELKSLMKNGAHTFTNTHTHTSHMTINAEYQTKTCIIIVKLSSSMSHAPCTKQLITDNYKSCAHIIFNILKEQYRNSQETA